MMGPLLGDQMSHGGGLVLVVVVLSLALSVDVVWGVEGERVRGELRGVSGCGSFGGSVAGAVWGCCGALGSLPFFRKVVRLWGPSSSLHHPYSFHKHTIPS